MNQTTFRFVGYKGIEAIFHISHSCFHFLIHSFKPLIAKEGYYFGDISCETWIHFSQTPKSMWRTVAHCRFTCFWIAMYNHRAHISKIKILRYIDHRGSTYRLPLTPFFLKFTQLRDCLYANHIALKTAQQLMLLISGEIIMIILSLQQNLGNWTLCIFEWV